jgi:hypothetical protein
MLAVVLLVGGVIPLQFGPAGLARIASIAVAGQPLDLTGTWESSWPPPKYVTIKQSGNGITLVWSHTYTGTVTGNTLQVSYTLTKKNLGNFPSAVADEIVRRGTMLHLRGTVRPDQQTIDMTYTGYNVTYGQLTEEISAITPYEVPFKLTLSSTCTANSTSGSSSTTTTPGSVSRGFQPWSRGGHAGAPESWVIAGVQDSPRISASVASLPTSRLARAGASISLRPGNHPAQQQPADQILWSKANRDGLKWTDFDQGDIPDLPFAAATASGPVAPGLKVPDGCAKDGDKFKATITVIIQETIKGEKQPIAVFYKKKSWVKPWIKEDSQSSDPYEKKESRVEYDPILEHERLHFDISEIYARKLEKEWDKLTKIQDGEKNVEMKDGNKVYYEEDSDQKSAMNNIIERWNALKDKYDDLEKKVLREDTGDLAVCQSLYDDATKHGRVLEEQTKWANAVKANLEGKENYGLIKLPTYDGKTCK